MKKDRVVALCLCVLLLGNFHFQHIAGIWNVGAPTSLPQVIWAMAAGRPFGSAASSWIAENSLQSPAFSGFAVAVVRSGWPQLAFIYDEVLLVKAHCSGFPAHIAGARKKALMP